MKTTKSTLTIAREALKAGQESLPDYRRPKSPKKFTQPQLFACLVVKEFRCLDYRGIWVLLQEWPQLRNVLGLKKVPHFTTLWAASKRLLAKPKAEALLNGVLQRCRQAKILGKRTPLAAIDSTGLESRHVSAYYTKRCQCHQGHYKSRYPKLSAVGDTANHLILGCAIDRGPQPDLTEARATIRETLSHQPLGDLLGDPGYEAEEFHAFCREEQGIRSIIPTTDRGRPRLDGGSHPVRGHYRQTRLTVLLTRFDEQLRQLLGATPKHTPAYAGVMSFPRGRELSVLTGVPADTLKQVWACHPSTTHLTCRNLVVHPSRPGPPEWEGYVTDRSRGTKGARASFRRCTNRGSSR